MMIWDRELTLVGQTGASQVDERPNRNARTPAHPEPLKTGEKKVADSGASPSKRQERCGVFVEGRMEGMHTNNNHTGKRRALCSLGDNRETKITWQSAGRAFNFV